MFSLILLATIAGQCGPFGCAPSFGYQSAPQGYYASPAFYSVPVQYAPPVYYRPQPVVRTAVQVPAGGPRPPAAPKPSPQAPTGVMPAARSALAPERRPTAAPGPALDADVPPPPPAKRIAQNVGGATGGGVTVPGTTNVAHLPVEPEAPVTGMPRGDLPSAVRNAKGNFLPNSAVNGVLWRPGSSEAFAPSKHQEAHAFVENVTNPEAPVPALVDDSGKYRVTVISKDAIARRQAVEDLRKGNGPLAPFKDKILVRSASPTSWEIKDVGLDSIKQVAEGNPGVVIQEPSGRVVGAVPNYSAQLTADALRKANPSFDPTKVPGINGGYPFGFGPEHFPLLVGAGVVIVVLLVTGKPSPGSTVVKS